MKNNITDINIKNIILLESPLHYINKMPIAESDRVTVSRARRDISNAIHGRDSRLVVIVGPCSIHDINAAQEYADRLMKLSERVKDQIIVVMRTYFEKPRTTLGWKGLINDPDLNGTFNVSKGLEITRKFLLDVTQRQLPCATEWLDPLTPQYLGDLISWSAIGARTSESQVHRQLASGISSPLGFKNGTGGNVHSIQIAIDAILASRSSHAFMGTNEEGKVSVVITKGNPNTHIVLRGGINSTNYSEESIKQAFTLLKARGIESGVAVDCSHGNSRKQHTFQHVVFNELLQQRLNGNNGIFGIMLESHLHEGRQDINGSLKYGVSITDACINWEDTEKLILNAAGKLSVTSVKS